MHENYFLFLRTKFIRYFFDESIKPFNDTKRRIEDEEPPFDDPPYSEDGEPPYLEEWIEADSAIEIVGLSCVSMLSESLKLYFQGLKNDVMKFEFSPHEKKMFTEMGYVGAYRAAFGEILDTDWTDCAADFAIIEQVLLARNLAQHGTDLTSFRPRHNEHSIRKHPRPIFAQKWELSSTDVERPWFSAPTVSVSRDTLFQAITQIETLAEYVENNLQKAFAWQKRKESEKSGT